MRRLYLNQGSDYSVYPLASIAGRPRIDKRKEFGVNNRTWRSEPNSYAIIFLPTPLVLSMCLFYFAFYDFPFISHHVFCAFVEYHLQSTNDLIVPSIYLFCRGYTSPKNWSDFPPCSLFNAGAENKNGVDETWQRSPKLRTFDCSFLFL